MNGDGGWSKDPAGRGVDSDVTTGWGGGRVKTQQREGGWTEGTDSDVTTGGGGGRGEGKDPAERGRGAEGADSDVTRGGGETQRRERGQRVRTAM